MKANVYLQSLLLAVTQLFCFHAFGQPANNESTGAINIPLGPVPVLGTNVGATANPTDPAQGCWGTANSHTVWYRFTTTTAGLYTVTTDNGTGLYETDTQIKLLDGTPGSFTLVACSEDNGSMSNTLAGQVTANLAAATTYHVMVDVYGTAMADFAISVSQNSVPFNDCIFNAVNLSAEANGLGVNGSVCGSYYFNPPGNAATDGPTEDRLAGDPNNCNGVDLMLTPIADHRDIWFYVDITAATPPFWVSVFQDAGGGPNYVAGIYRGTPGGTCGASGTVTGLTYVDCSNGDVAYVPPGNEHGTARDRGICSTPLHPRIDMGGLAPGRYYIRVWEAFGGAPSDGVVRLCLESDTHSPGTFDGCPSMTYVPCTAPNQDYTIVMNDFSNAAMRGNACNTALGEPQLASGVVTEVMDGCGAGWVTGLGYVNNVMNNTLVIPFMVDAIGPCDARVQLDFSNISIDGSRGKVAQIQVMNDPCAGTTNAVMSWATEAACLTMRPAGNAPVPAGLYYIIVDGQDGNVISFDLTIQVSYSGLDCSASACGPLSTEQIAVSGTQQENQILVDWSAQGLPRLSEMELQKSVDGGQVYEIIYRIDPGSPFQPNAHYAWVDAQPRHGSNMYRVVARDIDGADIQSAWEEVYFDQLPTPVSKLYPNPTTGRVSLDISLPMATSVEVRINDMRGMLQFAQAYTVQAGKSTLDIPLQGLAAGPKLVTVEGAGIKRSQLLIVR